MYQNYNFVSFEYKILLVFDISIYSAVRMKPDKKYLNFFGFFFKLQGLRGHSVLKTIAEMLPKMKKFQFLKFWAFFGVFFKNFDFWKILNFDMDQYFRMKLSA